MPDIELSDKNIEELDLAYLNSKGGQGPFIAMDVCCNRIHLNKEDLLKLNKLFGITSDDLTTNS